MALTEGEKTHAKQTPGNCTVLKGKMIENRKKSEIKSDISPGTNTCCETRRVCYAVSKKE